jgi:hypothetical protein
MLSVTTPAIVPLSRLIYITTHSLLTLFFITISFKLLKSS